MQAKMTCLAPMESRKGKGKGKGKKPSKCPSIDEIADEVAKEMSDEICIFQELGWLDADYNEDEAMYMADIASLPPNVSAALDSDDDFEECYMEVEAAMDAKMNKDKKMKACYKKMSDEDKAKLYEIGEVSMMMFSHFKAYTFRRKRPKPTFVGFFHAFRAMRNEIKFPPSLSTANRFVICDNEGI